MPKFTVRMTRHIWTYRHAVAVVEARDEDEAAKQAAGLNDLEWIEDDAIDEGPVDYDVSSSDGPNITWRED